MTTVVLTDAFVSLGGNDISDYVQSVSLTYEREVQDETAMGDTTRKNKVGLKNWSAELSLKQDFANGSLDDLLFGMADAGAAVTLIMRPTSAGVGADNPQYSGSCVITSYPPFGNQVGELATTSVSLVPAGNMTRAEA